MDNPKRCAFGHVFTRPDREGWWLKFSYDGRRIRRLAGSTRRQAEAKRARIHALMMQRKPLDEILSAVFGDLRGTPINFRDLCGLYLEHVKKTKRPGTVGTYVSRLRILCAESWARKPVERIRPAELSRWAVKCRHAGTAAKTVNYRLIAGSGVCSWALELGLVSCNPFTGVKKAQEKLPTREVFLTPDEARALQDAATGSLRPILHCALATGMRRGELLALTWADVDLDAGTIRVRAEISKSGKDRWIPCTAELLQDLRSLRGDRQIFRLDRQDAVFERAPGKPWKRQSLTGAFKKALAACDAIPAEKRDRFRFHDLRHTAASLMVAGGVPLFDVAKILGHASTRTTMVYSHFSPEAGLRAISALSRALTGE
ncbi:MAG: tyrosine-type recombinase/integrase [Planctomycetota bacterium]